MEYSGTWIVELKRAKLTNYCIQYTIRTNIRNIITLYLL